MPSYEEDLARFTQLMEQEAESLWAQAEHLRAMVSRWGRGTAQAVAGDTGLSAGYVRQLIGTAHAFPDPAGRAQDLSFSHHRVAAFTDDPHAWLDQAVAHAWLDQAVAHAWSVEDLRAAIQDAQDPVARDEQARRAAKRLERAVARFVDDWAATYGAVPVLTWASRPRESADVA
jgi:hypothetical protein